MKLLERYLRQIERYLPYKERKDTINELRGLILEEVEQSNSNQTEDEILFEIIIRMGEPREIASKYSDSRPLVSKEIEPILILVLKIVSITLPLALLFAQTIAFVTNNATFTLMDVFLNIAYNIPGAIYALLVSIGSIFIIFILIERFFQPKFEIEEKKFDPNLLPVLPEKVFKVTLFESLVTITVTVLIVFLVNFQQGLISIYYDGGKVPLLNSNFNDILPYLNIGWFASILMHIYYAYKRRKNLATKTLEFIHGLYSGVILIILATGNIFNEVIINGYNLDVVPNIFKVVFIFIGIAAIIGSLVDYIKMYVNLDEQT